MSDNENKENDALPDAEEQKAVSASNGKVLFKGEIEIYPAKRLPYLDKGPVKAYEAKTKDGAPAFAMVCEKTLVPQAELAPKYVDIISNYLPRLIAFSIAYWPLTARQHAIFVYENKLGKPIAQEAQNPYCMGIKADLVVSGVLRNMVENLKAMADINFSHGNICTQNLFHGMGDGYEGTMLGEMLSVPSGFMQPILFETIARSVADPLGRGAGTLADDMYALGVLIATLIRTHDPLDKVPYDEVIARKIESSSFNVIVGQERFPGPVLELLRGLLTDSEELRWNIDDVMSWMDGNRVAAKQSVSSITKGSRPIEVSRKKFLRPQHLAMHLPSDPASSVSLVENGDLYLWLNRSLQNKEYEVRYEEAVEASKRSSGGTHYADRVATYVAMALSPGFPLMYRDVKFFPHGFGNMLANAAGASRDLGLFVDIIQSDMLTYWGKVNVGNVNDSGTDALTRLETCARFLKQTTVGYGLERCVYYLSQSAPCLSEKLTRYYVRSPEEFVKALEDISDNKDRPEWFMDRHIIAFLCVRDKTVIEPYLADLSASERHRQRIAALRIFAAIQKREKIGPLPGLSLWISGMLGPVINRFHDREKRKKVADQLEKIKGRGELDKISDLFDNFQELQGDLKSFAYAMRQYQALKGEHKKLSHELATNEKFGLGTGKQTSMVVSGVIAMLVVIIYLVFSALGGR